jgi:nucleotide-binding universal stress UspA family protein
MFKKILVPFDGSELAAKVLPKVVELAKTFKAEVTLFHVCHTETFAVGEATPEVVKTAPVDEKRVCVEFLSKVGNDLKGQGVNVTWACEEGVPAWKIIDYAQKNGMDLIAMGTHGRGDVAWALGSVAERVAAHATVPVLLFRVMELKAPLLKEEYFAPGAGL